ncbi:hypothetical protein F511_47641 [Dorcoceras hygrometricum]|uniref:Uncharacterized protein n=1 Tax=Dorcoceras hygrometricum TaxID=472368 RepID=A0A2Z6ZQJ7_9LAMI|nr:hypothetical protein F511_47641 [Dorcoceras hygrometricum]
MSAGEAFEIISRQEETTTLWTYVEFSRVYQQEKLSKLSADKRKQQRFGLVIEFSRVYQQRKKLLLIIQQKKENQEEINTSEHEELEKIELIE